MSDLLTWSPLISAASAFVAALLGTTIAPWIRDRFARKRVARYLAIRVVCILDKYLEDCASVALDWGREDQEGCSQAEVSAPSTPVYPNDLDWRSIDHALMYDLLSFPMLADKAASITANADDNAFPPDYAEYFETRSFQYATVGLNAFALANKLRAKYGIAPLDRSDWDPVEYLNQQLNQIKQMQEQRAQHAAALAAKADKDSPL